MVAEPGQLRDEDEDAIDDELDISEAQFDDEEDPEDAPPLTRYERGAVAWGLFTGLIHIFLDGTFAVFNHLVSFENDQGGCRPLVRGSAAPRWGGVDKIFEVGLVYRGAGRRDGFGGRPRVSHLRLGDVREDGLAPRAREYLVTTAQMWTLGLYFATEAHVDFEDTDRSDFVKFWLLFVGTTVIRFLLPVPVLWGSIKGVMRDAEFHHRWHLQYIGSCPRRSGSGRSELEPFVRPSALSIKVLCVLLIDPAFEERCNLVRLLRRRQALGVRDRAEARAVANAIVRASRSRWGRWGPNRQILETAS